jgi:hypothetical protein
MNNELYMKIGLILPLAQECNSHGRKGNLTSCTFRPNKKKGGALPLMINLFSHLN